MKTTRRTLLSSIAAVIGCLFGWRPAAWRQSIIPGLVVKMTNGYRIVGVKLVKNVSGARLEPGQAVYWGKDVEPTC